MADSTMIIQDGMMAWFDGPEWDQVVADVFQERAPEVQTAAQANAIWADRTGNARAGLTASVTNEGGIVVLSLYHTVPYGIWLETIQSGRFAVLMRTLEEYYRSITEEAARAAFNARRGDN